MKSSSRVMNFLQGEARQYLIPDIHRLLNIRPDPATGEGACTIPTAMFLFVISDLFGYLIRNDCRNPKLSDTRGNLSAIFSIELGFFSDDYIKHVDLLTGLFRNGLMHQIFPKAAGIRKAGMNAPLFEKFDRLYHLNVDRFGQDVLNMLATMTDWLTQEARSEVQSRMSNRLDKMSESDFSEMRRKSGSKRDSTAHY